MLSRVSRTIAQHDLFAGPNGRRVLVGVSGGPDSMALLACLWELAPRLGLELEVGFVDHGLRAAAGAEGDLVEARARALGLPCHRIGVDVPGARARARGGGGIPEVARRLRLAALEDRARRHALGAVALGHQADDQTETVLFRILRGTGIAGLAGIPYRRAPFVRPLLDVTREQVIEYLRRRSIAFVSDPSNGDLRYARARLRHQVLPALRRENPRVDEALRRLAASAAGRLDLAGDATSGLTAIPGRIAADVAQAQRRGHGTQSFDLPGARQIVVTYGQIRVRGAEDAEHATTPYLTGTVTVVGPGVYPIGPGSTFLVAEHRGEAPAAGELVWFDGAELAWPLALRARAAGDRMQPRRGAGTRKLADLMIDAKIPRDARDRIPVVVGADGKVLFVPGLRPSGEARPTKETRWWIGLGMLQPGEDVG